MKEHANTLFEIDSHAQLAAELGLTHHSQYTSLLREAQITNSFLAIFVLSQNYYHVLRSLELWPQLSPQHNYSPAQLNAFCHPHDRHYVSNIKTSALQLLTESTNTPLLHALRLSFECRWLCADGSFRRCIHHYSLLHNVPHQQLLVLTIKPLSQHCPPQQPYFCNLFDFSTRMPSTIWSHCLGKPLLSNRQIEIIKRVAQGLDSKTIAQDLFLSLDTVNNHRRNILQRINISNHYLAMSYLAELGLI